MGRRLRITILCRLHSPLSRRRDHIRQAPLHLARASVDLLAYNVPTQAARCHLHRRAPHRLRGRLSPHHRRTLITRNIPASSASHLFQSSNMQVTAHLLHMLLDLNRPDCHHQVCTNPKTTWAMPNTSTAALPNKHQGRIRKIYTSSSTLQLSRKQSPMMGRRPIRTWASAL
jgi:hypothetical protein